MDEPGHCSRTFRRPGDVHRSASDDAGKQCSRRLDRRPGTRHRRTDDHRSLKRDGRACRRLLLGRAGRLPARQGGYAGGVRYAGGAAQTANYETVSAGDTGHAESVRITYDPSKVTYGKLLQIFFSVVQDPTELNFQGPDHGTQYRSVIFAQNKTQKRVAESYIAQLDKAAIFPAPIVTTVSPAAEFFPAEAYHQDFLNSNPTLPYIEINDMPKLNDLKQLFPEAYREQPVLVLAGGR